MYYSTEVKEAAKRLFLRRCKAKEIQAQLNLPNIRIVYYWIRQGGWEDMLSDEEPLTAVGRRITLLLDKVGSLSKDDLNELDRLTVVRERLLKQAAKPAPAAVSLDDQVEGSEPRQRPRGDPAVIAINLNEFCERATEHKQKLADVATLRDLLKESRSRKFLDSNKAVHSAVRAAFNHRNPVSQPRPTTVKCWTFKA